MSNSAGCSFLSRGVLNICVGCSSICLIWMHRSSNCKIPLESPIYWVCIMVETVALRSYVFMKASIDWNDCILNVCVVSSLNEILSKNTEFKIWWYPEWLLAEVCIQGQARSLFLYIFFQSFQREDPDHSILTILKFSFVACPTLSIHRRPDFSKFEHGMISTIKCLPMVR